MNSIFSLRALAECSSLDYSPIRFCNAAEIAAILATCGNSEIMNSHDVDKCTFAAFGRSIALEGNSDTLDRKKRHSIHFDRLCDMNRASEVDDCLTRFQAIANIPITYDALYVATASSQAEQARAQAS